MLTVTRGLGEQRERPYPVVTIGNFDGHHRGHRALLQTVVETAWRHQGTALVLTFDPHPVKILAPHVDLKFLTTPDEKLARFQAAGIDEVVLLPFTVELASMTPQQFVETVLCAQLRVAELFVGEHFAFGKGRTGRIGDLMRLGETHRFLVHPVSPVTCAGGVVSSTRIRQLIQAGEMTQAAELLGRPYGIKGVVVQGRQQGQELGWPTANIPVPPHRVVPADGVYAARATLGAETYAATAYIGTRPTFGAGERLIEVYLLDQTRNLYGQELLVEFVERLRGDHAFASPEDLAAQIARDVDRARGALARLSGNLS